ncbi:MAG: glycosyltransferase family 1 protein [Sphingobacteriaceae bacterium]|nr:glycosyltransferase family 1 protein [Sphingobacteriaceae bacterium]
MVKAINIISFDIPFPANYGGVIDVYHKLRWLHKKGVEIHLHCFEYGRKHSEELEKICKTIHYYKRKTGIVSQLSALPYTVKSRQSEELAQNLLKNNYPILFEVLHTCYLLRDVRFIKRKKIYRHSNIEHEYYKHLASVEPNMLKKYYLTKEALKLEKFEPIIDLSDIILAVNADDANYFSLKYQKPKVVYLPSFHANDGVDIKSGKGDYVLYHGNLSVSENADAALWLAEHVFSKINQPCIIAGLNPSESLINRLMMFKNIKVIANPDETEMNGLIQNAQVHCLYTSQDTGLKLKLLNCLYKGRFIVSNAKMLRGTGIQQNSGLFIDEQFIQAIQTCFNSEFNEQLIHERKEQLKVFDNSNNADKLIETVFDA